MIECARIMKRGMSEVNTRTHLATSIFIVAFSIVGSMMMTSCGGSERRADRLWRQATQLVEKGDTRGAVERLQEILDEYPDARVAEKAREQIVVYRGLVAAVESYPSRRAHELMVQIARAIETFRRDKGRAPGALDDLVPSRMASLPRDPWGGAFLYETTPDGYRLTSLGADGAPGGSAESADVLVVDGEFATELP